MAPHDDVVHVGFPDVFEYRLGWFAALDGYFRLRLCSFLRGFFRFLEEPFGAPPRFLGSFAVGLQDCCLAHARVYRRDDVENRDTASVNGECVIEGVISKGRAVERHKDVRGLHAWVSSSTLMYLRCVRCERVGYISGGSVCTDMTEYQNVLVVVDGTDTAVSHAVGVSETFGAKLHALYVFDASATEILGDEERAGALEKVEAAGTEETGRVAELAAEHGIDTARAVREGVPHRTVVRYAEQKDIDLVVVRDPGTDEVSSSLSLGATRIADVPVMTVPDEAESDGYESIVVPTDGSDSAVNAAERAVALAERYDADVHAVYVVKSAIYDYDDAPRSIVGLLKEAGENATDEVVTLAEEAGVSATKTVVKGTPYEEVLQHAEDVDADLVSMGKLGLDADERDFIGSTTERVLRGSDLPVLSVE